MINDNGFDVPFVFPSSWISKNDVENIFKNVSCGREPLTAVGEGQALYYRQKNVKKSVWMLGKNIASKQLPSGSSCLFGFAQIRFGTNFLLEHDDANSKCYDDNGNKRLRLIIPLMTML